MGKKAAARTSPKKKTSSKKPAPPRKRVAKPGIPTIAPDPRLKREYERLVAIIGKTSHAEMKDFDARWEAADRIVSHDPPLYRVAGIRNDADFFRDVMKEEPRTATRYVRVARFATPMEEEMYGVAKLNAAIGFLEAKIGHKVEHPPLPIAFDLLTFPTAAGVKPLKDCTVAEIQSATSKLLGAKNKRPHHPTHTAIVKGLSKVASLEGVTVHEHSGVLSFRSVPIAALARFATLLHAAANKTK